MSTESLTQVIQVILAPVVMVTACSILLSGLLGHYAAISDRLRTIARERIEIWRTASGLFTVDPITTERLEEFRLQVPELLHRLTLMRNSVLAIYGAIFIFVLDMFVIALAALAQSNGIATAALVVFLMGTALKLVGIAYTAIEIRLSQRAVTYEARRGLELDKVIAGRWKK